MTAHADSPIRASPTFLVLGWPIRDHGKRYLRLGQHAEVRFVSLNGLERSETAS
jgi:hypothetical protein